VASESSCPPTRSSRTTNRRGHHAGRGKPALGLLSRDAVEYQIRRSVITSHATGKHPGVSSRGSSDERRSKRNVRLDSQLVPREVSVTVSQRLAQDLREAIPACRGAIPRLTLDHAARRLVTLDHLLWELYWFLKEVKPLVEGRHIEVNDRRRYVDDYLELLKEPGTLGKEG
jgi:hypothetical protein